MWCLVDRNKDSGLYLSEMTITDRLVLDRRLRAFDSGFNRLTLGQ